MAYTLPASALVAHGAFPFGPQQRLAFLAGARDVHPHVDQLQGKAETAQAPLFSGTPDDFLAAHNGDAHVQRQMKNKVRKCPSCGKPVAFTMSNCNGCSEDLSQVEISFTNNVFTGFIYGIEKGPFPFTISMRHQTPTELVFDDLLVLCPCHVNVIPSDAYIPDWRFLLKDPKGGVKVLERLYNAAWKVVKEQFLENESWRNEMLRNGDKIDVEKMKEHLAVGFNYPPSQYQLHLQFMLPPFTPFHYYSYLNGLHFTHGRFFPVEYARKVLALNVPYEVKDDTPIEDIIVFYKEKGVDYDAVHRNCYDRYGESHRLLANWKAKDFKYIVEENKKAFVAKEGASGEYDEATEVDVKALQGEDKTTLQNYGRPYKSDGKPSGSYYWHAQRDPSKVVSWQLS